MRIRKFYVAALVAFAAVGQSQTVRYMTVASSGSTAGVLSIQTNQIISLVGYDWASNGAESVPGTSVVGTLANGQQLPLTPFLYCFNSTTSFTPVAAPIPQMVAGLTGLSVTNGWATFQITTPATTAIVSNYVPADAIVIPASASGNVQIILESSPDLLNWTAADPGTYGVSAGANRFFRVRAAAN